MVEGCCSPLLALCLVGLGSMQTAALIITATNVGGFLLTAAMKSEVITDLCGTGAIGMSAWLLHRGASASARSTITSSAIGLWSVKLASFLAIRAFLDGDKRLQAFLPPTGEGWSSNMDRLPKLLGFWFLQGLWGLTMLTPQVLSTPLSAKVPVSNGWPGLLLAGVGLVLETWADGQKFAYKRSGGDLCTSGVYSVVRYPNYTGEILFWLGLGVYYYASFSSSSKRLSILAFLPAAFVTLLLTKASGIPLTEAGRRRRYKNAAEYAAYVANVPWLLFPWIY